MTQVDEKLKKLAEIDRRIDSARFLLTFKIRDREALLASIRSDLGADVVRTKFIDFNAHREPTTDLYCVACQKDLARSQAAASILLVMVHGAPHSLHPDDLAFYQQEVLALPDGAEFLGPRTIGADCARRHGAEWIIPTQPDYFNSTHPQ